MFPGKALSEAFITFATLKYDEKETWTLKAFYYLKCKHAKNVSTETRLLLTLTYFTPIFYICIPHENVIITYLVRKAFLKSIEMKHWRKMS